MQYVFGIGCIILGVIMIVGTGPIIRMFGRIEWAEEHLHTEGGTKMMTKWIGLGFIILGFIFMGGWFEPLLRGMFGN